MGTRLGGNLQLHVVDVVLQGVQEEHVLTTGGLNPVARLVASPGWVWNVPSGGTQVRVAQITPLCRYTATNHADITVMIDSTKEWGVCLYLRISLDLDTQERMN